MNSQDKGYQGWKNYETWNVALWLDNDHGSYTYWHERAQEVLNTASAEDRFGVHAAGSSHFTDADAARLDLADALKEHFEEAKEALDLGASVWADLLGAALSEVDWHEIAEHYLDDKVRAGDADLAEAT